jgi:hypothetical protein
LRSTRVGGNRVRSDAVWGKIRNRKGTATTSHDIRVDAAYPIAEAARYLRLAPTTLRSWFLGRPYPTRRGVSQFPPVLKLARRVPPTLSFSNLIEAHVLRSLRTEHGLPLSSVRKALTFAERELRIEQLLLREELRTSGNDLFLDQYGRLINLSASGQLAMRKAFEAHLRRVEWGPMRSAVRLYPFVFADSSADAKPIIIDPKISFGRPVVDKGFVSTRSIVDRMTRVSQSQTSPGITDLRRKRSRRPCCMSARLEPCLLH